MENYHFKESHELLTEHMEEWRYISMSKNWDYSNLTSEAKGLGGPELYKQYLYNEGKRDGSKVGIIAGVVGILIGLGITVYEEGPKAVAWVRQNVSEKREEKKSNDAITCIEEVDVSSIISNSDTTPKAEISPEIFGLGRMTDEERYNRCKIIFDKVTYVTGVRLEDIQSKKRSPELCRARDLAMYMCREYANMSLEEIARVVGKHDHTSVMSGINRVKLGIKRNYELKKVIDSLYELIKEQNEKEATVNEET